MAKRSAKKKTTSKKRTSKKKATAKATATSPKGDVVAVDAKVASAPTGEPGETHCFISRVESYRHLPTDTEFVGHVFQTTDQRLADRLRASKAFNRDFVDIDNKRVKWKAFDTPGVRAALDRLRPRTKKPQG